MRLRAFLRLIPAWLDLNFFGVFAMKCIRPSFGKSAFALALSAACVSASVFITSPTASAEQVLHETLYLNDFLARHTGSADGGPNGELPPLVFNAGFALDTQAQFRGVFYQNDGPIIKPYIDTRLHLLTYGDNNALRLRFRYEGGIGLKDTDFNGNEDPYQTDRFYIGAWASVHPSEFTGIESLQDDRVDFDFGLTTSSGPNPESSQRGTELSFRATYNDAITPGGGLAGQISLIPYIQVAIETEGNLPSGNGAGQSFTSDGNSGISIEVGARPTLKVFESEDSDLRLGFPVRLGLGISDYYQFDNNGSLENETFGFLSIGAFFDYWCGNPLGVLETPVSIYGGLETIFLGDATEQINSGDNVELVLSAGINFSY